MGYLVDDYVGNERTTGKLQIHGTVKGQLQKPHDEDWFAVSLEAGVTYYLNLTSYSPVDSNELVIGFFDPRLQRMVAAVRGDWDKEFALEFKPASSGTYYAVAVNYSDNFVVSDYKLGIAPRSKPDDFSSDMYTKGVLAVGASSYGTFEQRGDVDWFKFHAEKGYRYQVGADSLGEQYPLKGSVSSVKIVDAYGRKVVTPSFAGFNPVETGDYYVAVRGASEGAYGISVKQWRDDFPQYQGTEGRLVNGGTVTGSIDYEHDADWFRIAVEKGKYYSVGQRNEQGFYFTLNLRDEAGELLKDLPGDGGTWQATETGTVYLEVERQLTTRLIDYATPYSISLAVAEDDIGEDAAHASVLALGASAHGSLQMGTDRDAFKIRLEAGVTYRAGLAAGEHGGEYLKLEFAGVNDGKALASKRVGSGGSLEFTPLTTGEYTVTVASDGGVLPNLAYTLQVGRASDDWAANMAGAGQLAAGSVVGGTLESAADRDWYAVRLEAGVTYWIEAKASPSDAATGAALRILDTAGNPMSTYAVPVISAPLSFKAESGGTYYVEMSSLGQRTGAYTITAAIGTADDVGGTIATAAPLAPGATFKGRLEVGSDRDVFRLDAIAGQTYVVKLNQPEFYSYGIKLTDASGQALTGILPATANWNELTAFLAETTGAVYATVQGNAAGAYEVQVQAYLDDHPDWKSATAKALTEGGTISGTLEHGTDHDFFGMQLDANHGYVLKVRSASQDNLPPVLNFTGPGHISMADQSVVNGERTIKFVTQTAGQYYLELNSPNFKPGAYTLTALPFDGDGQGPTLVAQSPSVNVPLTERTFSVKFSEPVVVDKSAIVLRDSAGNQVVTEFGRGEYYPSVKGETLTIKAAENLRPDTYTLSIPAAAIHDGAGNRYSGPETLTFSTVLAVDQPSPGNGMYAMKPGAVIDGGPGLDTLSIGASSMFSFVSPDGSDYIVRNLLDGTSARIRDIERLIFADQAYALDVDGIAGQAYRLYQAAFNRAPDRAGLGFWIGVMDGGTSLLNVADAFVGSKEFIQLYGSALPDTEFVQTLYQNVLHRSADKGGLDFWVHHLLGGVSRAEVLMNFSESLENKMALAEIIGSGFTYQTVGPS
jgi:hypothetical protein